AQEVAKNEAEIASTYDKYAKQYPDAGRFKELIMGRIYESFIQGKEADPGFRVTEEMWEQAFKKADAEVKDLAKAVYGEKVKNQTQANSKAKDVGAGGGTTGRAPKKYKT